ncbi:MAG: carboxypeptidase regulatory-like domain-containing protein, partial [Nocardioides sp.]
MSHLRRRAGAVVLVLAGLLASLMLVGVSPASAANGKAVGQIIGTEPVRLQVKMLWFDAHWHYLGQRRIDGDIYSISLAPGTYHLQFVDLRPSYDVTKYAPSDVTVTVPSGRSVQHDVKMHRGGAITGVAKGGNGKPLGGARVVAANTNQQSYETKANGKGQFAVGGLPAGSYSVFTYDRDQTWVGKSLWVPKIKLGEARNVLVKLKGK